MSLSCLIAAMTSSDRPLTKASGLASCAHASGTKAHMSKNEKSLDFISAAVDVVGRVDHLEQRRAREVARSEVSVVHRQDRSSDQCKRVCQQARANEARGAFRDRVRQRQTRGQAQQLPRKRPRMRQVVFAPDPAYDPFGEAGSILFVQPGRPQHPDMQYLQLREAYRSDATRNVGFDDA